jgi:two-component system, NarL family, sensor kinase
MTSPSSVIPGRRPISRLEDLLENPRLRSLLLDHAHRGVRVQGRIRVALAVILFATVLILPPDDYRAECLVLASVYLAWALLLAVVVDTYPARFARSIWVALYVDLVILTALTVLAGVDYGSWTADVLVCGFLLLPLLAATQLRPFLTAAVCVPTVALYFAAGVISRVPNGDEPWTSICLRTAVLLATSIGAVLLSRLQRSRVLTMGRLATDRAALASELVETEERARRDLSEQLHDGALQYLLAARMDLEDLEGAVDPDTYERLDQALKTSAQLLRSTVSELHPAVLASSGLAAATEDLLRTNARRGGFIGRLDVTQWPDAVRTDADPLLYATIRELLGNAVKHAKADTVVVTLRLRDGEALVSVADDGVGFAEETVQQQLAAGHIGLSSRRARLEAAGGSLQLTPTAPHGTTVLVDVPARPVVDRRLTDRAA